MGRVVSSCVNRTEPKSKLGCLASGAGATDVVERTIRAVVELGWLRSHPSRIGPAANSGAVQFQIPIWTGRAVGNLESACRRSAARVWFPEVGDQTTRRAGEQHPCFVDALLNTWVSRVDGTRVVHSGVLLDGYQWRRVYHWFGAAKSQYVLRLGGKEEISLLRAAQSPVQPRGAFESRSWYRVVPARFGPLRRA